MSRDHMTLLRKKYTKLEKMYNQLFLLSKKSKQT